MPAKQIINSSLELLRLFVYLRFECISIRRGRLVDSGLMARTLLLACIVIDAEELFLSDKDFC